LEKAIPKRQSRYSDWGSKRSPEVSVLQQFSDTLEDTKLRNDATMNASGFIAIIPAFSGFVNA
jgi:hypothetical protein